MSDLLRILHVDDDDDIRTVTKVALEVVGGFEVSQFSSGPEAIKEAQALAPQLCLLDVMMPVMSGEETWERLSNLPGLENASVIFMTAKAEESFSKRLLEQGALTVITKPFDLTTLCSSIRDAWADREAMA